VKADFLLEIQNSSSTNQKKYRKVTSETSVLLNRRDKWYTCLRTMVIKLQKLLAQPEWNSNLTSPTS